MDDPGVLRFRRVRVMAGGVGASLRLERCAHGRHGGAQSAAASRRARRRRRSAAIPSRPAPACAGCRGDRPARASASGIRTRALQEILVRGGDAHDPAVVGAQAFAVRAAPCRAGGRVRFPRRPSDRSCAAGSSAAARTAARARRRAIAARRASPGRRALALGFLRARTGNTAAPSAARSPARRSGARRRRAPRRSPGRRRSPAAQSLCIMLLLADLARVLDRDERLRETELAQRRILERRLRHERHRRRAAPCRRRRTSAGSARAAASGSRRSDRPSPRRRSCRP